MATYQIYEFEAIDQPLTDHARSALLRLGKPVTIDAWHVLYNFNNANLPTNEKDLLLKYFDALLSYSDWGIKQLMFRFPRELVDIDALAQYQFEYAIELTVRGQHVVLDMRTEGKTPKKFKELPFLLRHYIDLRMAIMRQDYRSLYIAWLGAVDAWGDPATMDLNFESPPIPPGMRNLDAAHEQFAEFFGVDANLISTAAEYSRPPRKATTGQLRDAIADLTAEEQETFLLRLAKDEPYLALKLNRRLQHYSDSLVSGMLITPTIAELLANRNQLTAQQQPAPKPKRNSSRQAPTKKSAGLTGRLASIGESRLQQRQERAKVEDAKAAKQRNEETLWRKVRRLIQKGQPAHYDEAIEHLLDLQAQASTRVAITQFNERIAELRQQNHRKYAFIRRLDQADL